MNYKQLKIFATNLNINRIESPLNALKLVSELNIPYVDENAARVDFKGKNNPLWDYPACLYINEYGKRKIYYNSQTRFWNFYLMHEIAHWLLGHAEKSYRNELDADLLACILLVPPEIVFLKAENSYEVYKLCNVPIDKADMYWQEIFDERFGKNGE